MKIAVVVGTRPELIKMAILIKRLKELNEDHLFIHSGQHYDYFMDGTVIDNFSLPQPDYNLKVGSGSHAITTSKVMKGVEEIIDKEKIDTIIVHGDTNTTLGASLAAVKMNIKIAHVEAGLRSFDRGMPEEINRLLVDHIANYLFTPTDIASENLKKEGITNGVYRVGQTLVDALDYVSKNFESIDFLNSLSLESKNFYFVTVHRQENTDDPLRLQSILKALRYIADHSNNPIVFSLHPRTKRKILDYHLFHLIQSKNIMILDPPTNFINSVLLQKNAKAVLTDSGGLQEESCILGTPCITLRENTERPETIECGANRLAGYSTDKLIHIVNTIDSDNKIWSHPYGNCGVSQKVLEIINNTHK